MKEVFMSRLSLGSKKYNRLESMTIIFRCHKLIRQYGRNNVILIGKNKAIFIIQYGSNDNTLGKECQKYAKYQLCRFVTITT